MYIHTAIDHALYIGSGVPIYLKCLAMAADGANIKLPAAPILHVRSEACLSIGGGWRRVAGSLAQFSVVLTEMSPIAAAPF